ncbi:hypothetical protein [Kitasatospora kifunensis]|uniref:ESX-1 secretion-associated protein n=1 Tax=Kitasatospora kifunensis TaxID=58351 RepID=A0A7W7QYA7_KITKI|nr:hypothetical protein [Kitasatospora kifunensis]MBB4921954.1 hypothetical protein [Kitasatospora kifunensis]
MADGFKVDLGALESAASGINGTLYDLQSKKVSDIGGKQGDFGHGHLADTVSDFCGRWELGVEHLAKDAQVVAGRLTKSVEAYLATDKSLKGQLDGIVAGSGTDPGVK